MCSQQWRAALGLLLTGSLRAQQCAHTLITGAYLGQPSLAPTSRASSRRPPSQATQRHSTPSPLNHSVLGCLGLCSPPPPTKPSCPILMVSTPCCHCPRNDTQGGPAPPAVAPEPIEYSVMVKTADKLGSGTDATVTCEIVGSMFTAQHTFDQVGAGAPLGGPCVCSLGRAPPHSDWAKPSLHSGGAHVRTSGPRTRPPRTTPPCRAQSDKLFNRNCEDTFAIHLPDCGDLESIKVKPGGGVERMGLVGGAYRADRRGMKTHTGGRGCSSEKSVLK